MASRLGILPPRTSFGSISSFGGAGGNRKTLVKVSYSKRLSEGTNGDKNTKKISYISRDEATGEKVRPFYEDTTETERVYTAAKPGYPEYMTNAEAAAYLGDVPVFRVIISPEDKGVDLTGLAVRFLQESFFPAVGTDKVHWVASNHYNTEHPHVHILISRIPENAKSQELLHFAPAYLVGGRFRRDAGRILDSLMGLRTPDEERRLEMARAARFAFTDIDRLIESRATKDGPVLRLSAETIKHEDRATQAAMRRRLSWLSRNAGSVWFDKEKGEWNLRRSWKDALHIEEASSLLGITPDEKKSAVVDSRHTKPYKGIVRKSVGIDDEPDKALFSIEGEDGRIHVLADRLTEGEDPGSFEGKEVEIGFQTNRDGSVQKKPRIVLKDGLVRLGKGGRS